MSLPFCATRYQDSIALDKVTAPPYDVLQPKMIETLRAQSPYNAVYLSKNKNKNLPHPYAHIPDILKTWHAEKVLQTDAKPFYYYAEDTFTFEGLSKTRKGFFALIEIQKGETKIIPHEHTLKKHIQDRLHLMDQTNAHLSPIFLIGDDPEQTLYNIISSITPSTPQTFKRIDTGEEQTFGTITDLKIQQQIQSYFENHDLLIADGHHRFKTALEYANTHNTTSHVLAFIASSADPGLVLSSIHRAIKHEKSAYAWIQDKMDLFTPQPLSKDFFEQSDTPFALLDYTHQIMYLYKTPTTKTPTISFEKNIIENQMQIDLRTSQGQNQVKFFKHDQDLQNYCQQKQALGFWLKAMKIEDVFDICKRGEILPQKSTYFFPKVLDGLVYCELQQ
ncbi:MAG: DUF1015 domain-containing protein [Bdellovibrionota bacterium]